MHHINCTFCGTKLKIKKIPEGKDTLKLKCPKCLKIFSIDISSITEDEPKKPAAEKEIPKTNGISEEYLEQILSATKKEPTPPPKAEKPIKNLQDLIEEEPKDIFSQEKPQEFYYVIKANGSRIGPFGYADLLQKVKDGEVVGIDTIETKSGFRKPPISFIEIKRILQEKIREQKLNSGIPLGIDTGYSARREKRKITLYLLLGALGILLLVYGIITIPKLFRDKPDRIRTVSEEPDTTESVSIDEEIDGEDAEEKPISPEKTVEIINFSDSSIQSYFSISGNYYGRASNNIRSKNYDGAIKELDDILVSRGSNPTTILLKLQTYLMSGDLAKAYDDFQTMVTMPALQDDMYINLGFGAINTMLGHLEEAKTHIERTRFIEPENPFVLFYSSILEYRLGNISRAVEYMESSIRYSPPDFVFLRDMRSLLSRMKKEME